MLDVTKKLVELMDLAPLGDDHFQGQSEDLGFPNLCGGHVLGQALMAATRTIEGRMPHSMHAYFLR
ncbi:MAG: acyl-CoA thioesterase II, partial [Ectothiorhodospiraceae bacterium]|nr:acyl-CoA thioesterase II [Ectothiorhodospiraceae bacterium]